MLKSEFRIYFQTFQNLQREDGSYAYDVPVLEAYDTAPDTFRNRAQAMAFLWKQNEAGLFDESGYLEFVIHEVCVLDNDQAGKDRMKLLGRSIGDIVKAKVCTSKTTTDTVQGIIVRGLTELRVGIKAGTKFFSKDEIISFTFMYGIWIDAEYLINDAALKGKVGSKVLIRVKPEENQPDNNYRIATINLDKSGLYYFLTPTREVVDPASVNRLKFDVP